MPKAFVTGATGFIGGALARNLLVRGWEVHGLLREGSQVERLGDLQGRMAAHSHDGSTESLVRILTEVKPDVVFHLASLFISDHRPQDVRGLIASNILFATQLAEAMVRCGSMRLVNTGTSWQHFDQASYRPVNLYAATKQAFEDILAYYHDACGLSAITLKLYDTYGPDDRRPKLVNLLLDAARSGQPLALSPGDQTLDLVHVDDVVSAFRLAGERLMERQDALSESYFVSGSRLTVQELVKELQEATSQNVHATWGGRPYRAREVMMPLDPDGGKLPGWAPIIPLREGLKAAYGARKGKA